ncbi:polysaccharide deacetylase family protein [Dactylosporangium sp. NPDC051485]|uniref:polysaccharide deacetylase family protein n=1 Tax=Dactylosporangium sp. NPDC051485 TaxID=3154846 RepID=UPI00344AF3DE
MFRTRLALGAVITAAALALAGCAGHTSGASSWHASGSGSAPGDGGQGGGDQGAHPYVGASTAAAAAKPSATASASPSAPASTPASTPASPPASASTSPSTSTTLPAPGGDGIIRTTGSDAVALTFDDGPGPDTPKILQMLRAQGIKATFCLIGVNVQEYPQYVQQIVQDGHTLCNHTWKHDESLGKKSADTIRNDLQRTSDEIHKAVPNAPIKYFRHPGGNFTPLAVQIASELGMESIGWSVDPFDWNTKKWSGQQMTNHIVSNVRNNTKPGSIVLSHDGGGDRSATVAAYKTLLPELKAKFTLVALPV